MLPPIVKQQGTTPSERRLAELCSGTFLDLWSYPNVFRDQGGNGSVDGKEVCDLLVVFGKHIILFSDKDCDLVLRGHLDLEWKRWFKRAVRGAEKQLRGAERWIKTYPHRLFVDKECQQRFPIDLLPIEELRFHRVAVARGSTSSLRQLIGGQSGSLILFPPLKGRQHDSEVPKIEGFNEDRSQPNSFIAFPSESGYQGEMMPFTVGDIDPSKPFIHVFDDETVELLLGELDTIRDFVDYLDEREDAIRSERLTLASGEEDVLANYLQSFDENRLHFIQTSLPDATTDQEDCKCVIPHGEWDAFKSGPLYRDRQSRNQISYRWDELIQQHSECILNRDSAVPPDFDFELQERAIRAMAAESRLQRRGLMRALMELLADSDFGNVSARLALRPEPSLAVYVFILVRPFPDETLLDYRERRQGIALAYLFAAKRKHAREREVVVIATAPNDCPDHQSQDIIQAGTSPVTDEEYAIVKDLIERDRLLEEGDFRRSASISEYSAQAIQQHEHGDLGLPCECGSGKRKRNCHYQSISELPSPTKDHQHW